MFPLLVSLFREYLALGSVNKSRSEDPYRQTIIVGITLLFIALVVTLGLVVNRTIEISEEYAKYRKEHTNKVVDCTIKNHQDDSLDRGNGLDLSKYKDSQWYTIEE